MFVYETDTRFYIGARAQLIDDEGTTLKAWAEKHVRKDPDIGWILGNFVEADNANGNGHIFPIAELEEYGVHTPHMKPLNMLHHPNYIVGAFAGAELLYPEGSGPGVAADASAVGSERPVMEALSAMWRKVFPDEHRIVQKAHNDGALFYSMECLPPTMTCPSCTNTYKFVGLQDESYCAHLNASRISPKILHKPHFEAGALIIPPVQPGWSRADITQLSKLIEENVDQAEKLHAGLETEAEGLGPKEWETMMLMIMLEAAKD